ncbi:hypothetical protein J4Q44_G00311930 [Coregonus suidteri]|uniref:Uncharacterized protein n=1 Tax=Coregonus suidteri TaxID=861788 RepID=A0AAN8KUL6_9TELE
MDSLVFRRVTEELQLSQKDLSLTRTENTHLTAELEKLLVLPTNNSTPVDRVDKMITCLEKQVVALQAELQSLSEENQKQAEELALWRLTAQTPCLDPEDPTAATLSPGHNTVTVIREDELLLSCTSNRAFDGEKSLDTEKRIPILQTTSVSPELRGPNVDVGLNPPISHPVFSPGPGREIEERDLSITRSSG